MLYIHINIYVLLKVWMIFENDIFAINRCWFYFVKSIIECYFIIKWWEHVLYFGYWLTNKNNYVLLNKNMVHTHIIINIWNDKTIDDELIIFGTTLDCTDAFGTCNQVVYPLGVGLHACMTCEHLGGVTYWMGYHLSVMNALRGLTYWIG